MMQEQAAPLYSPKVLEALNELLQNHQALLWVDPTTNSLAVKHITQPLQEDEDQ